MRFLLMIVQMTGIGESDTSSFRNYFSASRSMQPVASPCSMLRKARSSIQQQCSPFRIERGRPTPSPSSHSTQQIRNQQQYSIAVCIALYEKKILQLQNITCTCSTCTHGTVHVPGTCTYIHTFHTYIHTYFSPNLSRYIINIVDLSFGTRISFIDCFHKPTEITWCSLNSSIF